MGEWVRAALDLVLIGLVGAGLVQAARLIRHLAGLRQGRLDMERFVYEFNATVLRAEAGIKGLRQAARESGDDLEKLVEKSILVRDELHFIVESADQVAERLSKAASGVLRPEPGEKPSAQKPETKAAPAPTTVTPMAAKSETGPQPASKAEKELLQALKKLS